jgi:hypothetical protein
LRAAQQSSLRACEGAVTLESSFCMMLGLSPNSFLVSSHILYRIILARPPRPARLAGLPYLRSGMRDRCCARDVGPHQQAALPDMGPSHSRVTGRKFGTCGGKWFSLAGANQLFFLARGALRLHVSQRLTSHRFSIARGS